MMRDAIHTLQTGSHPIKSERGQGFTELAISLVFLLTLMSAVIDLGWAFYTLIALRDTAQEAASYGAICPFTNDNETANLHLIRERLLVSVTEPIDMNDLDPDDITIRFTTEAGTPSVNAAGDPKPVMGGSVVVTATVQHQILTPFVGTFIGGQGYPLTVTVADTVVRSKWLQQCEQ